MILTLIYISLTLPCCDGLLANLFLRTGFDGSSTVYGTACLTSDFLPTCGWKFVLYSSLPITDMA
ncbi:hypothetical protein BgiMline_025263, partial [Biomphalaria glabrata]